MNTSSSSRMVRTLVAVAALLSSALLPPSSGQELLSWGLGGGAISPPQEPGCIQLAAGVGFSVGLYQDGSLIAWGLDTSGQVSSTPTGAHFVQVASGFNHSLALDVDGRIWSWGSGTYGLIVNTPQGTGFTWIAAGGASSFAIAPDGSLVGWGEDNGGMISNIPSGTGFIEVAAGIYHAVALRVDGTLVSWGSNTYGQVSGTPGDNNIAHVTAGMYYSLATRSDGSLVSWGSDQDGAVSGIPSGAGFTATSAGFYSSLAINAQGEIVAWGTSSPSKGSFIISDSPVGGDFLAIAAGMDHAVAIRGFQDCNQDGLHDPLQMFGDPSLDLDGDFELDECQALSANNTAISWFVGGTQKLTLDAGVLQANQTYFLLGSTAGTEPGTSLTSGDVLPLNLADPLVGLDPYFLFTLLHPNTAPLTNGFGVLDAMGRGNARFAMSAPIDPAMVGLQVNHAYVVLDSITSQVRAVSNAWPLTIAPF